MQPTQEISSLPRLSYGEFIWRIPAMRKYLLTTLGGSVLLFVVFKLLYPYPDFFGDSYNYIHAAATGIDINIYPIGYSKFLSAFHALTISGTALTTVQFLAMQFAMAHLVLTVVYFTLPTGWTASVLLLMPLILAPLTLYLGNTVNSDALFAILSLLWLAELIWIIYRPRLYQVFLHAFLLFACFTVRNNGYYYPVVGAMTFLLSYQGAGRKVAGMVAPLLMIVPFIWYTQQACLKLTGTKQFSLFTGWQLSNNALYMYDQIDVDSSELPTPEAKSLNRYAIAYFRMINSGPFRDNLESYVGNFFIRQSEAPLKQFYARHYTYRGKEADVVNWARASAMMGPFGRTLIQKHPVAYAKYFVLPNIRHYFLPPLSHIGLYNYGQDAIDPSAQTWFQYKEPKVVCVSYHLQGYLLLPYVGMFLILNLYYLINLVLFFRKKGVIGLKSYFGRLQVVIFTFFTLNFLFSIISTVNILRYQFVPMAVLGLAGLILGYYQEDHIDAPSPLSWHTSESTNLTELNHAY